MTEPVRTPSLTHHSLGRRSCASSVALTLALLMPVSGFAAPEPEAASDTSAEAGAEAVPEAAPAAEMPEVAAIEAALADGDLSTATELALARRVADPSADNYALEAAVWEALGDYEQAKAAHLATLEALPEDSEQRAAVEARLAELEEASRGTEADEPASVHRERLDQERADRLAALLPTPEPPPPIIDAPVSKPITQKWYFWVTLGAIVASAGAIVGIAVSTAVDENNEGSATASGARRAPTIPVGGAVFRF